MDQHTLGGRWVATSPVHRRMRPIVWVATDASIAEAAGLLDGADRSCVLVRLPRGLGIATDHDFRASLADPTGSRDAPVATIASMPAVTISDQTDSSAALLEMVDRGFHHLVVTTDTGEPAGVVRAVDLASAEVREPLLVRRLLRDAGNVSQLREAAALLPTTAQELAGLDTPALRVTGLLSALRDLLVRRVVELASDGVPPPDVSWLVLGSSARREALPRSDVDTALAWSPAPDLRADQLRTDADVVLQLLETCGLPRCPDGANATEPLFSRSVDDWTETARRWTAHPESQSALLLASIVADNRAVSHVELGRTLTLSMLQSARNRRFLDALLTFTLAVRPARGIAHHGRVDLKRGGLWPVVLLGRWLGLVVGDTSGSTVDRVRRGAHAGLLTVGEGEDLAAAYEQVFQLRFDIEIAALRAGTADTSSITVADLDALPRRYLHDSLKAVAGVQGAVRRAWGAGAATMADLG